MWPFSQIQDLTRRCRCLFESSDIHGALINKLKQRIEALEEKPPTPLGAAHTAKSLEERIERLEDNREACMKGIRRINDRLEQQDVRIQLLSADVVSAICYYKKRTATKKRPAKRKTK